MNFKSFEEIIDFAVKAEEAAQAFYNNLAEKMEHKHMKTVFTEFALEELGHKKKLLDIKAGNIGKTNVKEVLDLKIGDYLIDIKPTSDMDFQSALILAMKAEKKAYALYLDLSNKVEDKGMKEIFLMLAHEEANHKLRFEIEYDDMMDERRREK